ncbi:MAG: hypothetical protein J6Q55_03895, partial [Clostridia bacterium]|nr:hypothetical protein [Clostridia bacterium]
TTQPSATISVDNTNDIIAPQNFVSEIKSLVARLSQENPDFIFFNKVLINNVETTYQSSDGVDYSYKGNSLSIGLLAKHKQSANVMDEFVGADANYYDQDAFCADAKLLLDNYLNKIDQVEEDELPVICEGLDIFQYMLNNFVADLYCNNASLLNGKLGQQVFNKNFSFVFDRDAKRAKHNVPFYDAEGVVNDDYKIALIENGVFKNLLTTKKSAAQYGVDNIGTANASYITPPSLGLGGATIPTTHASLQDILGNQKAIYISMTGGGDATPSGDVSVPCMTAYLYQDGKLQGRLPGLSIGGNVFSLFGEGFMGVADNGIFSYGNRKHVVFKAKLVNKETN